MNRQHFSIVPGTWAVVQLPADHPAPAWALAAVGFVSITRTTDELSVVCPAGAVPAECRSDVGWALIKIHGPLPFAEIGILASFAESLGAAHISLFAVSTYDTDYLLVKETQLDAACRALEGAGHILRP